ncbi:hypothetical protein [Sphingosinicella sp. BN140058]|uniref:hypothetical protein n=1 Tax=Sphingosinicella sp. BN140058 TaxID=1892855 RepID=UPI0010117241|nr:hypothetical protein [Sphingosinicella sp. BN140058]QAY77089.1 hypothetical protein ETR14_11705 [Sphingosinicella sp. BN140058]
MKAHVKTLIGLLAALVMAWLWHGPGGQGEALIDGLEQSARSAAGEAELPGVSVRMVRDPLSRTAIVSGTANDLQREGLGSQWGVVDYVRNVPGMARARWDDEKSGNGLPLLAETMIVVALAYLAGLGLGALIFGRRKRQSFLD